MVLVADAHCYSAADIFAAGFQDNEIGNILFVGSNTGAGGADVMEHKDLVDRFKDNQSRSFKSLSPLPCGTGLSVAVRRVLRTGSNGGVPLEDIGLKAKDGDDHYDMKREDILGHNESLLAKACQMLVTKVKSKSVWPDFYVLDRVSLKISEDKRVKFSLVTSGLESIHVSLFLEDNEVEQPEELDGQAIIDFPFDETSALIKIVGRVRGGESVITTGLFI